LNGIGLRLGCGQPAANQRSAHGQLVVKLP